MKNLILIILQILLAFYIIFMTGALFVVTLPFVTIQLLSIIIIVWALIAKKHYKKRPTKSTPKGTYFVKEGPYEFIRHPIYTAIILFVFTYVEEYFTFDRAIVYILFIVLIILSIKNDEKLNEDHFKHEYIEYKKKTKKIFPYVY